MGRQMAGRVRGQVARQRALSAFVSIRQCPGPALWAWKASGAGAGAGEMGGLQELG